MTDEPPPEPDAPPEVPLWLPFVVLFAVLLVVNTFAAAVIGLAMAADPSIKTGDLPPALTLPLTLFQDLVFVFGAWIGIRLVLGRATREQFGLRRPRDARLAALWAIGIYAAFWAVLILLSLAFGEPDDQTLVNDIRDEQALGVVIAYGALVCVAAPFVEELFFRGFMFTILVRRLPVGWAAAIVGVVFGIAHAGGTEWVGLIALGVFGFGLCILYWRTQSIVPCMALHALQNSLTFAAIKTDELAPFVGIVVLGVGTVVAGATAVSVRSRVAA